MYADPRQIRRNTVKVSLNDKESELLDALANFMGEQKATLVRELLLERAMELLHEAKSADDHQQQQRAA